MFKIFLFHILVAFISVFSNLSLFAQQKRDYLFLGDTIRINEERYSKLSSEQKSVVKDLGNSNYLIKGLGKLPLGDKNYQILDPLNDGVTKILVIGNSFSDDAVESYFYDMARSTGKPVVIGNLFRGGAPLNFHLKNALGNIKIYSYRKTSIDGIKSNTDKTSIMEALKDENWDYICFQQASALSGDWSSIEASLPALFEYVRENYPVSTVQYLYHQTWAYAQNASTKNFDLYGRDQQLMYNRIVEASKKIANLIPLNKLIPTGTAIQNARTSYIGDNFTREGYHLDLAYGRFTAASTWYETIFGNISEMSFKPTYLNDKDILIAKESASQAVQNPYQITPLEKYVTQKSKYVSFQMVRVNFGSDLLIAGWNSLLFEKAGSGRFGLLDDKSNPTSINILICESFDSRKSDGLDKTSFRNAVPSPVSKSYFQTDLNDTSIEKTFIQITNLDRKRIYKISLISTLAKDLDAVAAKLVGANTEEQLINPSYNRVDEYVFEALKPSKEGKIEIKFKLQEGKKEGRAILNGLIIEEQE